EVFHAITMLAIRLNASANRCTRTAVGFSPYPNPQGIAKLWGFLDLIGISILYRSQNTVYEVEIVATAVDPLFPRSIASGGPVDLCWLAPTTLQYLSRSNFSAGYCIACSYCAV
ncbi:MAG TPA: hypothetical protein PKW99_13180, partial [Thauera sp.]|nr:hypothetical protein [Thauera sp.]